MWPEEALEERAADIAVAFASLLGRQASWRHRRVETIHVLSHEQVRRTVSIDFTVPAQHHERLQLSDREWIVPLAVLAKRPLVRFDLRDEAGASLALLRAEETQLLTRELLELTLDLDVAASGAELVDPEPVIERVLALMPPTPPERAALEGELAALEARAGPLPGFTELVDSLVDGYLLCALVDDVARRRVVKFAYDEPLTRAGRLGHIYDAFGAGGAATFHAEIALPDELRARNTELQEADTREVLASGARDADHPALYFAATGKRLRAQIHVLYATERGRFLVSAALVAWVIALQLALPWLLADLTHLVAQAGPAIAILLSSSAVFSGLVLRAGEPPLVRAVLAPYRLCLGAATVAAVAAASALGFHGGEALLRWSWGLGALVAAAAAVTLTAHAVRAPSRRRDSTP